MKKGFTLIELLIVVAIIAILAAIAVPNFLEAQVRAKISRAHADMRTIVIGLESYKIDSNWYPPENVRGGKAHQRLNSLSSPIAYLTTIPVDPFALHSAGDDPVQWDYHRDSYMYQRMFKTPPPGNPWYYGRVEREAQNRGALWWLCCLGPNKISDAYRALVKKIENAETIYDPTNGTISAGDIERWGP